MTRINNTRVRPSLPLATAIALTLGAAALHAEDIRELETIYVYGRVPVPEARVAATVTHLDRDSIAAELVADARDLVRYTPGLTVPSDPHRFGLDTFAIRGLGGNRVAIEVDGIPAPSGFSIGSYSDSGRTFVDTALVERVEILRGPASALYGSDAIAGVVSARTIDAGQLLGADASALQLQSGYSGASGSWNAALLGAVRIGGVEALAGYVRREGHETASAATSIEPNPLDYANDALLLKVQATEARGGPLRLSVYAEQGARQTTVNSFQLAPGRFANTVALTGDDVQDQYRVALAQTLDGVAGLDRVDWGLYWQDAETTQDSDEERRAAPPRTPPQRIQRRFELSSETIGMRTTAVLQRTVGAASHDVVFGIDALRTETRELRGALATDLLTGTSSNTVLGETFPVRDFPPTTETRLGVFIQDEIRIAESGWTLIPAFRVEHQRVDARADQIYSEDNTTAPVDVEATPVAPKLGIMRRLDDATTLFAQYAHGYRAPPPEDVNIGFEIPAFNYRAVPNPALEPETSDAWEIGVRHTGDMLRLEASAFRSDYRDFIESRVNLGTDPITGVVLFQSQNVEQAHIQGAELTADANLASLTPSLTGWSAGVAVAWAEGRDEVRDVPLNSTEPLTAVLRLGYLSATDRWGGELATRLVSARHGVDQSRTPLYETDGFVTLDLYAHWQLSPSLRLDAAVYNLTEAEYIEWADVRGRATGDPLIPYYTQPGRNVAVTLRWATGGR